MLYYRFKNFIYVTAAFLFAIVFCVGIRYGNVTKLSALEGERVYYLDSASSQGLQKSTLTMEELYRVKGESVSFDIAEYEGGRYKLNTELAHAIADMYGAQICIVEEVCGTVSYYGYTTQWREGIRVRGELVNLHIAINGNTCVVGTPIIFGGF